MRTVLAWLLFDCYLTSNGKAYTNLHEAIEAQMMTEDDALDPNQLVYSTECHMVANWKVGPLALPTNEWQAAILRHNGHTDDAAALDAMQHRKMMGYRVCSVENEVLHIERADDRSVCKCLKTLSYFFFFYCCPVKLFA